MISGVPITSRLNLIWVLDFDKSEKQQVQQNSNLVNMK